MPLTDEEKQWLQKTLGTTSSQPISSPTPTTPGILPPGIPMGQPYVSSLPFGKGRITVPPPPAEVQRQLAVEQARAEVKAKAPVHPKPPLASHTTAITQTDKAIERLHNLIQFMEQKQFQTGPLSLRFQHGTIPNAYAQFAGTKDEVNFKAMNERFLNEYITAQTGAQRGFKEMQWLGTAVPNPALDLPTNYLEKAKATLGELQDNRQQMLDLLQETGYDVSKVKQNVPIASSSTDPYLAEARRRGLIK